MLSAVLNLNQQTRPEIKILSFCTWFSLKQLITCSFWFSSQCEECVGLVNSVHLTRAWKKTQRKYSMRSFVGLFSFRGWWIKHTDPILFECLLRKKTTEKMGTEQTTQNINPVRFFSPHTPVSLCWLSFQSRWNTDLINSVRCRQRGNKKRKIMRYFG